MAVRKRVQEKASNEAGSVAVAEGSDGSDKKDRAPRPKFQLKLVGEMPAKNKRGGGKGRGKGTEYMDQLNAVKQANDQQVYEIAQFFTTTGAQSIKRLIQQEKKEIPDGKWVIESRTVRAEMPGYEDAYEQGVRSVLLAQYLGE